MMLRVLLPAVFLAFLAACRPGSPASAAASQPATTSGAQATRPAQGEVVVYTALDEDFSRPILEEFTRHTGIEVRPAYDTESTKTVGLTNRIRAEAARPRCDVFWNNEVLNTLQLKHEGLLQPCRPDQAENYPPQYRDPDGFWYGFAARARVIIANTQLVRDEALPSSIHDLMEPRWERHVGIAKPLFGTTATHVACLFAQLGESPAKQLLAALKENRIRVLGGNKACAESVGAGQLAAALTDTDDAIAELDALNPVRIILPDARPDQMGTLVLPNTLALIKGCPHPEAGARLINYLLSPEVEARLATGPSAQIPLNKLTKVKSRIGELKDLHPMPVDFTKAAEMFPGAAKYVEEVFLQ